jgi:hypothetical protein
MKIIRYWGRIAIVLTGLGAPLGAVAGAAPAATNMLPPPESDAGPPAARDGPGVSPVRRPRRWPPRPGTRTRGR